MKRRHAHDRELLDALEQVGGRPLTRKVWRVAWKTRHVLHPGGAGGRWNPVNGFDALYTSLQANGAIAEVYYHLSLAPVRSSADKLLYSLKVRTRNTLQLDNTDVLGQVGVSPEALRGKDQTPTQAIGAAAHLLEYDSLLVPSARWRCNNLIILPDYLPLEEIEIGQCSPLNWPAWREQHEQEYARLKRQSRAR